MTALLLPLALLACVGDKDGDTADAADDTAPQPGTLALTFAMNDDYIDSLDDGEEALGDFTGSIFYGDEVDALGPIDGAVVLESVFVAGVDLRPDGGPTGVLYTTGELPGGEVVILGYLDTDVSGGDGPDGGDPVTLPSDNDFDVDAGETTVEVYFGLLNP